MRGKKGTLPPLDMTAEWKPNEGVESWSKGKTLMDDGFLRRPRNIPAK